MSAAPDKGAFLGLDDVDDLLDAEAQEQEPKKINVAALVRSAEGDSLETAIAEAEALEKEEAMNSAPPLAPTCCLAPRNVPSFEAIFGARCPAAPWSRMWPPLEPPKAPKARKAPTCGAEASAPSKVAAVPSWPSPMGLAACGDPDPEDGRYKRPPLRFIEGWNDAPMASCYNPGDVSCGATISSVRVRLKDGGARTYLTPWSPFWGHYACSWIGPNHQTQVGRAFPEREAWTGRPWFMEPVCGALAKGGAEMRPLLTDLDCYERRWNKKAQRWEAGRQTRLADGGWERLPEGLALVEVEERR